MRSTAALLCVLTLSAESATAQAPDPYAAGVAQAAKERRQRRHDDFMNGVETYSYAAACKVVAIENARGAIVYSYVRQATALGAQQPIITSAEISKVLSQGDEIAKVRGCNYWMNNPERVLELRQAVLDRRMP